MGSTDETETQEKSSEEERDGEVKMNINRVEMRRMRERSWWEEAICQSRVMMESGGLLPSPSFYPLLSLFLFQGYLYPIRLYVKVKIIINIAIRIKFLNSRHIFYFYCFLNMMENY